MPKSAEGNPLATKPITITLSATTRLEYAETIEVPADATHAELDALVAQRYDQVDAGLYVADPDYWRRDRCSHAPAVAEDPLPRLRALRVNGHLVARRESGWAPAYREVGQG